MDRRTLPFPTASASSSSRPTVPELQPAEHLWAFVDEPLANGYFKTLDELDAAIADRCRALIEQRDLIRNSTLFHWWPKTPVGK